jgi:hypothetical protein
MTVNPIFQQIFEDFGMATSKSDAQREKAEAMGPRKDPKHPMFRDHNCWRCNDGEKPCVNKRGPHDCEYPHARND